MATDPFRLNPIMRRNRHLFFAYDAQLPPDNVNEGSRRTPTLASFMFILISPSSVGASFQLVALSVSSLHSFLARESQMSFSQFLGVGKRVPIVLPMVGVVRRHTGDWRQIF